MVPRTAISALPLLYSISILALGQFVQRPPERIPRQTSHQIRHPGSSHTCSPHSPRTSHHIHQIRSHVLIHLGGRLHRLPPFLLVVNNILHPRHGIHHTLHHGIVQYHLTRLFELFRIVHVFVELRRIDHILHHLHGFFHGGHVALAPLPSQTSRHGFHELVHLVLVDARRFHHLFHTGETSGGGGGRRRSVVGASPDAHRRQHGGIEGSVGIDGGGPEDEKAERPDRSHLKMNIYFFSLALPGYFPVGFSY
mmetsp:Transcript_25875/g.76495  ORF Transcript_25875/g.76495 Transcript_25875/m.76495 type:complete len:252 (+) Transcript_25875:20-775(+)